MDKKNIIAKIYSELNDSEKYGIRFALFPFRIHDVIEKNNISTTDLMLYDDEIRSNKKIEKSEYFHYSDFEDDHLMAQFDDRTELENE